MLKLLLRRLHYWLIGEQVPHPREVHAFVSRVATSSYDRLIVGFALILLCAAAALALLHSVATQNWNSTYILSNAIQYVLALLDFGDAPGKPTEVSIGVQFVWLIASAIKLLLIVFVLGIIVFKFLVLSDVFVARKKASIFYNNKYKEWELALRVYNATKIEILDIKFEAFLRVPEIDESNMTSVPNSEVEIRGVKEQETEDGIPRTDRSRWPIAIPFVPYTINIPLHEDDVRENGGKKELFAIQGRPIAPTPNANGEMPTGHAFLVLIIHAKTPELSGEIIETRWFDLSREKHDFEFERFEEIKVIAGTKPKAAGKHPEKWQGWKNFEAKEKK